MTEQLEDMERLAQRVRSALDAADLSAFGELLDPNVRWGAPGDPSPMCRNRAQVLSWYQGGRNAGVRARVSEVTVVGDRTILVGLRVVRNAAPLESGVESERWQVLTVGDGRVVDIVGFDERSDAVACAGQSLDPSGSGWASPRLPRNLVEAISREHDEQRRAWVTTLPGVIEQLERHWSLRVGEPFQPGGQTAWVAPARGEAGGEAVLKLAWRHREAEHEADALRAWNGQGAVLLHAAEALDGTIALLLERCTPGSTLASRPEPEQDTVVASLLPRLWREPAPGHPFRPLQQMCDVWADEFERKAAAGPMSLDPGLAREGIALFRALPATAERNVLLCTDMHAENVLAAQREPWLAIDPKPYVGDPTYDALQHLLNCDQRLHADPGGLASRMAELLGLDTERLLLWLFARCVQESLDWPALADVARRVAPG
ncbi:MAG: nuclear transport factor 2 family protein [Actinomycetota bacterium]|nr:nuclear transport factor 2 family protein [Actinomycetota bacterium]